MTPRKRAPSRSFRRDADFGRGRAHLRVDVLFVLDEVRLEHADELARGVVEGGFVAPGLHWIEKMRLDAGHRGRHGKTKIGIGAKVHFLERAVERAGDERTRGLDGHAPAYSVNAAGPSAVDQPAIDLVPGYVFAKHRAILRRRARQE